MPELPEVETVVRSIAPHLTGRRIADASFSSHFVVHQDFETLAAALRGQQIHSVTRHGKFIVMQLDTGALVVHLGMTGKLLLNAPPGKHARAVFHLDSGTLVYDDIRHFGRIEWSPELPNRVQALGPDALSISREDFIRELRTRKARLKTLLLNQSFLRGLGNIYADEVLYAARIHPRALASRLSPTRAARLHQAIRDILNQAIQHKGSSISDYVDGSGNRGSYQLFHEVYGREGEPCRTCGSPIRRIVMAQRGTHYCPRCQKV